MDGVFRVKICLFGIEVEVEDGGRVEGVEGGTEDLDAARLVAREFVRLLEAVGLFLNRSTNAEAVPPNAHDLHSSTPVNLLVSFHVNRHVIGQSTY